MISKYSINYWVLVLVCFLIGHTKAQNLVPNGDFEQYSSCPTGGSQLNSALYWINPTNIGTPDYFNECATFNTGIGIPYNNFSYGYQYAHGGAAYSGIFLWRNIVGSNVREYIEVPLTDSLMSKKSYYFNMYVNLLNPCGYTSSNIGVYFSDTLLSGMNVSLLPFTPQLINSAGNNFDTLNWTQISGNYTANGGEKYLTIGNFNNDSLTDTLFFQNAPSYFQMIYCYIDDVSLTEITGIEENEKISFELFPNPANQNIVVNSPNLISRIVIYNNAGELVLEFNQLIDLNKYTIDISKLAAGLYHCWVYYNQAGYEMKKFSVIK